MWQQSWQLVNCSSCFLPQSCIVSALLSLYTILVATLILSKWTSFPFWRDFLVRWGSATLEKYRICKGMKDKVADLPILLWMEDLTQCAADISIFFLSLHPDFFSGLLWPFNIFFSNMNHSSQHYEHYG